MKWFLVSCLTLCGCTAPQMTLINNTPYLLNVTASNETVCTNLPPGHSIPIRPSSPWRDRTGVAVAAYDQTGAYVGANDWIFYNGLEQVWRIDRVNLPQP